MSRLITDKEKLSALLSGSSQFAAADRLYREQSIFFVGGALPVYETLETMFNSCCAEAAALFCLTFASAGTGLQGEEMARQIKKNFHVRLMARIDAPLDESTLERIYAAGADNLLVTLAKDGAEEEFLQKVPFKAARVLFPGWGVAAALPLGGGPIVSTLRSIDLLLQEEVVPLLQFTPDSARIPALDISTVFEHLVSGWEQSSVPLQVYLPLISSMTPLVPDKPAGIFRGIFNKVLDRHRLAESDLRRHLRVQHPENSLDSAGL